MLAVVAIGTAWLWQGRGGREAVAGIAAIQQAEALPEKISALTELMEAVGPLEAQGVLASSGIPFSIDAHLLVHEIGHGLWREAGTAAIGRCTDYFHFGCYHGVIHSALIERGLGSLLEIRAACAALAPHMVKRCSHGVGHTLFILQSHDLPLALKACDAIETEFSFDALSCYGGVFMENAIGISDGAGIAERWVRVGDSSFPCNDPRIAEPFRAICWETQPFIIEQVVSDDLARIARECILLPSDTYREGCYRIFTGWILYPRTEGDLEEIFNLCRYASPTGWYDRCLRNVAMQAFEAGERTRLPFAICARAADSEKGTCYSGLFRAIWIIYPTDAVARSVSCGRIDEVPWSTRCRDRSL